MPPSSPIPGQFNPSRNPYMRPIVAAFASPQYNRVTSVMGTQMGKSVSMENIVGWRLDDDPTPIMYVAPTSNMIDTTIEPKFMDMFRESPKLLRKYDFNRSTKYTKWIAGTKFRFAWAGSPAELAADSAGLVLVDEVDRIVNTGEGDTTEIIEARGDAYADSKVGYTATPTRGKVSRESHQVTGLSHWGIAHKDKVSSAIWKLWQSGTRHEWAVPCPHCGEYFIPHSDLLGWPGKGTDQECTPDQAEKSAWLACPANGCSIEDKHRQAMNARGRDVAPGQWVATQGDVIGLADTVGSSHYSLWVSGLCSFAAKKSYGFLAKKLVAALQSGDPEKLQAVYNTGFGECYAVAGDAPEWAEVYALRSDYSTGEVPPGVATLIGSVDVQKNRLVYVVRGWIDGMSSRLIEADELWGDTDKPEVWDQLGELLDRQWGGLPLRLLCVDGGYRSDEVYSFARRHKTRVRVLKGAERLDKPFKMARLDVDQKGKLRKRGDKRWDFDASLAKAWVHGRIHWPRGRAGDWLLPADVSEDYCRQIVAEEYDQALGKWRKVSRDNHFLDCEGMQYMAARMLRLDRRRRRLPIEESGPSATETEPSEQPLEADHDESAADDPAPPRKRKRRKVIRPRSREGFVSRYRRNE